VEMSRTVGVAGSLARGGVCSTPYKRPYLLAAVIFAVGHNRPSSAFRTPGQTGSVTTKLPKGCAEVL